MATDTDDDDGDGQVFQTFCAIANNDKKADHHRRVFPSCPLLISESKWIIEEGVGGGGRIVIIIISLLFI